MLHAFEQIVDALEQRRLSRREAVVRLGALALALAGAGGPARAQGAPGSTFRARGLDHIALRVTDVPRSRDFYAEHLGLEVIRESRHTCFMSCGSDDFVALFAGNEPSMDHYCFAVEGYDADEAVEKLDAAGLKARRQANRVYFDDPDGLTVQVSRG